MTFVWSGTTSNICINLTFFTLLEQLQRVIWEVKLIIADITPSISKITFQHGNILRVKISLYTARGGYSARDLKLLVSPPQSPPRWWFFRYSKLFSLSCKWFRVCDWGFFGQFWWSLWLCENFYGYCFAKFCSFLNFWALVNFSLFREPWWWGCWFPNFLVLIVSWCAILMIS